MRKLRLLVNEILESSELIKIRAVDSRFLAKWDVLARNVPEIRRFS